MFELSAVPLALAAVWSPVEGAGGKPAKKPIRGRRRKGQERPGTSDPPPDGFKPAKKPRRGEPPAEWSIANPPVSSPLMLSKPDNSLPPRHFQSTPNLYAIPPKLRWR